MSLIGLQSAVAAIIRHPRAKYDWKPEQFLKSFELTIPERRIVEKLSRHEELNKYAHGQAEGRLEVMLNHVDRIPKFIPDRVLKNIWFDLYEPTSIYTKSDLEGHYASSLGFLKFLLENKDARKRLKRSAPFFIFDLLTFEIAELELSRPLLVDTPLIENSLLSTPHFRVLDLEYDVPAWLCKVDQEDLEEFQRHLTLVFVKREEFFPRMYEITKEVKAFLLSQIGQSAPVELSSQMKSDLVTMGLFQSH
jgi:hypothetical protein